MIKEVEKTMNNKIGQIGEKLKRSRKNKNRSYQKIPKKVRRRENKYGSRKYELMRTEIQKNTKDITTNKETMEKRINKKNTNMEKWLENLERILISGNRNVPIRDSESGIKFNKNIKAIHPKLYLNSLKVKVRRICNIKYNRQCSNWVCEY